MPVLYLGIDAPPNVVHYPVIRTERIDSPELAHALSIWDQCTHVIFTSKNSVRYWSGELFGKTAIAIGEATAREIRRRGLEPLLAPWATQEGVIALLATLDLRESFVLYPRSKLARPHLKRFLVEQKIPHYAFDLYDTLPQKLEPLPDLSQFDEIVFTSPSTVHAFFQIFPSVPRRIALTPIGPITKRVLKDMAFRL
jgi:uroporphyrinogen-III synthase